MPKRSDRPRSGEIILYGIGLDLGNVDVPHCPAKGFQYNGFCPEAHAHGLLEDYVSGNELGKLHDNPPKSTSATSRSSGRFTLA